MCSFVLEQVETYWLSRLTHQGFETRGKCSGLSAEGNAWTTVGLRSATSLWTLICLSVLCCVCHVFLPPVSMFGLFPVLVNCDYELILVQLCFSSLFMIILCIYSHVCSVWLHLVYSLLPGVTVCVYLALPCLDINCYLSYILVCVFLVPPSCVHRDNAVVRYRHKWKGMLLV